MKTLNLKHEDLLLYSYIIFSAMLFFISNTFDALYFFYGFVIPLFFFPVSLSLVITAKFNIVPANIKIITAVSRENFKRNFQVLKDPVFICVVLYIALISFSTWIYPYPTAGWFFVSISFFTPVVLYILITTRLVLDFPDFIDQYSGFVCAFASLNALINIYLYYSSLEKWMTINTKFFSPTFGLVPDHYSTTSSITYGIFFILSLPKLFRSQSFYQAFYGALIPAILIYSVLLTQCRGTIVGLLVGAIFIFIEKKQDMYKISTLVFLVILIFLFINQNFFINFICRGASGRITLWSEVITIILERPLFGYGQRLMFLFDIGVDAYRRKLIVGHAHNLILGALTRGGLFSAVFLFVILYGSLSFVFKSKYLDFRLRMIMILVCIAGLVDYELIIFWPDWQWLTFWFPISLLLSYRYISCLKSNNSKIIS
jgi:O-Antigen ligase